MVYTRCICLPTYIGGYPTWYMPPYYTSLGTPLLYTVHPVLPGTLSPPGTVQDDEALGSNLGIVKRMRRIEAPSLPKV